MRILLAEDNEELAEWLSRLLRREHFVVDLVRNGIDADAALSAQSFDLIVLDLGLPGMTGEQVLRRFRTRDAATPVLILTASDAVSSRVAGLDAGADDYLVKPFDVRELEARIRVLLRRRRNDQRARIACGPLDFDVNARAFALWGRPLVLTSREHAVLEALILGAGRTVPKGALINTISDFNDSGNPNAVEVYVHRVRKKLEGSGLAIETLRGIGYVLREQP